MVTTSIPSFALYGEQGRTAAEAEFVHLESIESRSRLYGWEIGAHRHRGLAQLVIVWDGPASVVFDGAPTELHAPCAAVVPPAVVHGFRFTARTDGIVLTVAQGAAFDPALGNAAPLVSALFDAPRVISLGAETSHDADSAGAESAAVLKPLVESLVREFEADQPARTAALEWLTRAVLLQLARSHAETLRIADAGRQRTALFQRFRALLEEHLVDHWAVRDYARALNLTEGRLNRVCEALAGQSAFEVVQQRLLLEARRRLVYIAAPVATLAYELGFRDPAYFNRFFRRNTGMTPDAFRRQSHKDLGRSA